MLSFGTIFRYQENYYVHLIETDDTIYAAKILDKEITKQLVRNRDLKSRDPRNRTSEKPVYCFVVLSTKDFAEQAAHYGVPAMAMGISIEVISVLNEEDIKVLKEEIMNDWAVAHILKKTLVDLSNQNGEKVAKL